MRYRTSLLALACGAVAFAAGNLDSVPDPFAWLNDMNSPATAGWLKTQQQEWAAVRAKLPEYDSLLRRIREVQNFRLTWPPVARGKRLFFTEAAGNIGGSATSAIVLYVQDGSGARRNALEGIALEPGMQVTRFFVPSPDGRLLAFSYGPGGGRWLTWRILDVDRGTLLPDRLAGLHTTSATVAWSLDSQTLYYARPETPSGDLASGKVINAKVYAHRLGQEQAADQMLLAASNEPDRWYRPAVTEGGDLVVTSARGTSGTTDVYLLRSGSPAVNLTSGLASSFVLLGGDARVLIFETDWKAPQRRLVAWNREKETWSEAVAESRNSIAHSAWIGNRLLVFYSSYPEPALQLFELSGKAAGRVQLPAFSNVWGGSWGAGFSGAIGDPHAYFTATSMLNPGAVYRLDLARGQAELWSSPNFAFRPGDFEVRYLQYPSRDGTRVPLFLVHRKGLKKDGQRPVYLYGYGALRWASFPWFQAHMIAWMERGGIFALAGVRGGGEFGEPWHQAGIRTNRQNAVDDYMAAAQWLAKSGYTRAGRIVANGGSLSGALPAAALNQKPELFGASVIDFGALDLLRYQNHTGALMWKDELGDVAVAEQFGALRRYSPLHNIPAGRCLPPTLVMHGSRDQVVVPSHSFKYVAARKAVAGCETATLLQYVEGTGHSFGATAEQTAETWAGQLAWVYQQFR